MYSGAGLPNLKSTTTILSPSFITLSGRRSVTVSVALSYSRIEHSLKSVHLSSNHSATCLFVILFSTIFLSCSAVMVSSSSTPSATSSSMEGQMSALVFIVANSLCSSRPVLMYVCFCFSSTLSSGVIKSWLLLLCRNFPFPS